VQAKVYITLKPGVLDPQGKAIQSSLKTLGFADVASVRLGKYLEVSLAETDPKKAQLELEGMCKKLLANTVIEDYRFELELVP
jgi:phosphoribosylformylglycinamidine synthase PurS subunit